MKFYEAPTVDITAFTAEDILTESSISPGGSGDGNVGSEFFD